MENWTRWVIPFCKHELSRDERARWKAWMALADENRQLFNEATRVYRKARRVAAWGRVDERAAWERIACGIARSARGGIFPWRFVIAACVVLFLGGIAYLILRETSSPPPLSWAEIPPGTGRAMLLPGDGREIALGSGVIITDTTLGFRGLPGTTGVSYREIATAAAAGMVHTLIVPRGGEYFLELSDGSRVWLNADSEFRYPTIFTGERREVFLTGEAYFQVHEGRQPFIVESGGTRVEVLGTRFNVSAYRDESRVVTTLEEGLVRVSSGGEERVLLPGMRAVSTSGGLELSTANTSVETGWVQHRVFDFVEMPLGEITRQLQRWYDVRFLYRDAGLEEIPFTGTVGRDLPLQDVLRVIEQLAEIRFSPRAGGGIEVTRDIKKRER